MGSVNDCLQICQEEQGKTIHYIFVIKCKLQCPHESATLQEELKERCEQHCISRD